MFEPVDKSIFEKCRNEMKIDEFIHTDDLDSKKLMTNALDVCSQRIDSHILANGIFDVTDAEKSGHYIPNEGISNDEIKGIIGRLFDLQITRFDGYSPYQTYLISAYTNKKFDFKNDMLKHLVHSFIICFKATEKFLDENGITFSSYWNKAVNFEDHCCETDEMATRNFLQDAKGSNPELESVIDLAIYELDLATYMEKFPEYPLPRLPEIPPESSDIGIIPSLEFRSLPVHSPPGKIQIFEHSKAIEVYKDFYNVVNEYPTKFTVPETLLSFIDNLYQWGLSHVQTLNLARILLIIYIVSRKDDIVYLFRQISVRDLFIKDLKKLYIPESMFITKIFNKVVPKMETFIDFVVKNYTSQPVVSYGQNIKYVLPYWSHIVRTLAYAESNQNAAWHIPRTGVPAYDNAMKAICLIWAAPVTIHFTRATIHLGVLSEVFTPGDAATNALLLRCCMETEQIVVNRVNIIHAVHKAAARRGKKRQGTSLKPDEVRRELENRSEEEIDLQSRALFMSMVVEELRWADAARAIRKPLGQFYNAAGAFENRTAIFRTLSTFAIPEPEDFVAKEDELKNYAALVNERFKEAKTMIQLAVSQYGKTPERTSLLMRLIKNNAAFLGYKGGFLKPVYDEDCMLIDIVPDK